MRRASRTAWGDGRAGTTLHAAESRRTPPHAVPQTAVSVPSPTSVIRRQTRDLAHGRILFPCHDVFPLFVRHVLHVALFFVTRNILRRHSARKGNKTENSGDKAHLSERSTKNHFYQRVVIKLMPCATPASIDTAFLQSSVKPPSVPKPSEKGFPFLLPARSRARIFPFATKGETV